MPAFDIAITATYIDLYTLTVTNGTGSGSSYTNGQQVAITANAPLTGMAFARWTGATQYVASVTSSSTTVAMPAANIGLTATYSNLLYTLTVTSGSGSGSYTNGQQVAVAATVRSDRTFVQWTGDIAYVASVTSSSTTVTMPTAAVNITAMYTMTTSLLTENRILQFNDYVLTTNTPTPTWVHEGLAPAGFASTTKALLAGTNHYHRTGWVLRFCRTGCSGYMSNARIIPPKSPAAVPAAPYISDNMAANMQNDLNALIESPVFTNGIGTVYFEAINGNPSYTNQITVEIATDMINPTLGTVIATVNPPSTNGLVYDWRPLDVINLYAATSNDFTRYSRLLNYRQSIKLRIRRTGTVYPGLGTLDDAFTVIDNIRVSLPPADIAITKTVSPFEPGYPSVGTNLTIRCYVSNVDTNVPADSPRSLKVIYRWRYLNQVIGAWRTNAMAYVAGTGDGAGNGERYAVDLPPIADVGDLEYYFVGDFMGYVYQSPDYTGTGLPGVPGGSPGVYPYASENLAPRTLRGTADGGQEFSTRLRPYTSRYGALYAEADQLADPVPMALSGNGEWRAMAPLAGTGITNLTWRFKATGEYVPGSEQFSTGVTYWAAVSGVKGGSVPYGGFCVVTNADGRLSVGVDAGNYAMLTLNTESLQYLANRAEYQNFNRWPAPANFFSESNGQDPKKSVLSTFDTWPTNAYPPSLDSKGQGTAFEPIIGFPVTTNTYSRVPFTTPLQWVAGSAAYVSERPFDIQNEPAGYSGFRNLALRLKGGDGALGLGYVYNSVATLPDGLKDFSFKCRLGQGSLPTDIAYFRNGFTSYNYAFWANASILANSRSPETPSLSVIGYYQDADHFYEYRVTQIKDTRDRETGFNDQASQHALYKWVNGVATLLASTNVASITLYSTQPLTMRFYNTDATHTLIKCKYNATDYISVTDGTAPVIQSGSFGVLSAECQSGFSEIYYRPTDSAANLIGSQTAALTDAGTDTATFNAQALNWYVPAGRFVINGGVSPKGVYSVIPSQQLGVYVQPTTYSQNNNTEPSAPGGSGWQLLTKVTVTNFTYQTVTIPFNSWQSQYVMLQVIGGAADVAVDEMKVSSWHGTKSGNGDVDQYDWLATEAWVVSNATASANAVQLDFTRANPAVDQMIRAPLLDTGLGLMEFDYRVLRAPVKMTVQYALRRDNTVWTDVQSFMVSNVVGWTHASAYLGSSTPGYFRLLNDERTAGYSNAVIEIDNVTVWDEPSVTNNSWRAYNAKITQTDTNRVMLDASEACFLNNSQTAEASPSPLNVFQPYLMSPILPKGLGKLSFYARAYTNTQAGTLYIYATTNGWNAPENLWFEISRVDNITNTLYQLYTCVPVDGRAYNAVKLGKKTTDGTGRVCLDEVVVSEPVFPGFDIINVRLLVRNADGSYGDRNQPLDGEDTDVEARMGNVHLSPSNIVMYVSYYVGTNAWGIGNWPAGQTVTRRMHPVTGDPTLYRTRPDNGGIAGLPDSQIGGILGQDHDQVIQYYVWATYVGGIPLTVQQTTFDNPSWYFPVDLNATFASQGWSPYFFVYVVPVGAVWINEINATDYVAVNGVQQLGIWDNQYIEIAVPAWLDLTGWSVDLVTSTGTRTITIPSGLPEQTAVTNGYAFFVIGDAAPPSIPGTPALPKKDYGYPGLSSDIPRIMPGGLRLKRPLGMYEQAIAYDWNPTFGGAFSGELWAEADPEKRFVYVGIENNGGSLARVGLYDSTSTWVFPQTWTPGAPNIGQMLPSNGTYVPGVSNVVVTSLMNLDKGTQNGKRSMYYALKMKKGTGTNIVYQIDDWYRLSSLTSNQVEQLPLGSALRSYNLVLPNLQGNVDISADISLRSDLADYSNNSSVLNWILGFQDGALIPMYYNNRLLSMTEQYWLDANPTVSNTFECAITKFVLDPGTNFHLTVKMALNGVKKTSLQGSAVLKLQSKSRITDQEWQLLAQYSLSSASFDANNLCRVFVQDPFAFILQGVDPGNLFFRWVIELPDPRVSVQGLVNDLTP